jgi:putative hemolysin
MHHRHSRRALAGGIATAIAALALSGGTAQATTPHWTLVSSPNTSTTQYNDLYGVSCVTSSFCLAAGHYYNGAHEQTLIERRNGGSWGLVSSPNTSTTQDNNLSGVSCVSSSFCMATGFYNNGTSDQTLIERWNGNSWSRVSSPNGSSTQYNFLDGVSCLSSSFCMAAGLYSNGSTSQTLVERWNGSGWSLVSSPNTSTTQENSLFAVSCVSTSFCMAVGRHSNGSADQTLIEKWNGTSWSLVSSPNGSTNDNALHGVSCVSTSFCIAAGIYYTSASRTLVERWNGSGWSLVSSPNRSSTQDNWLNGVSCASASFCMAAGYYANGSIDQTLIQKWTGSSWSLVSSPNRSSTQSNVLDAASCVSSSFCMAAGDYFNGSNDQTLIEKW